MKIIRLLPIAWWKRSEWGYPDRSLTCSACGFEYDSTNYNFKNFEQNILPHCPQCTRKMIGVK